VSEHFREHFRLWRAAELWWDVLLRTDVEPLFSGRCTSEDEARYVANGLKQDELKTGSIQRSDPQSHR
jgi:hypothetical protein